MTDYNFQISCRWLGMVPLLPAKLATTSTQFQWHKSYQFTEGTMPLSLRENFPYYGTLLRAAFGPSFGPLARGRVEAAVTCRPPHSAGREQFAHPVPRFQLF